MIGRIGLRLCPEWLKRNMPIVCKIKTFFRTLLKGISGDSVLGKTAFGKVVFRNC